MSQKSLSHLASKLRSTSRPLQALSSVRFQSGYSSNGVGVAFDDKSTTNKSYFSSNNRFEKFREPLVAFEQSPTRTVPNHIMPPPYAATGVVPYSKYANCILIHDEVSIEHMRYSAQLARRMLDYACEVAKPGMTTDEVDVLVHEEIIRNGAYPSPLNYSGFPKSLCSSINEVVCHGIPDARPLQTGDVVSFDVSLFAGGVHGDNCATIIVGDEQEFDEIGVDWRGVPYKAKWDTPEEEAMIRASRRLVHATRESLYAAIDRIGPGACLTDVGDAIQIVADDYGYSTISKYRGHGIGEEFHCPPFVEHYRNRNKLELVPGMIFTIEPMLVEGRDDVFEWSDDWTVATTDGGMAAQFEHTVLITETGVEILTVPE
eukprot:Nitzschia sp. Nitz4//scaffold287_size23745//11909//13101//NITZ4_008460-RA/size23745-snap-gene-0.23-mRNA-1//1//CDS//3329545769//6604//frame0